MGEVIKSFMVGLGFEIDDAGLSKFNKAISNAAVKVTALYASINVLTGAIVKSISDVSEDFEKMGYELRIIAPAINKALQLRQAMLQAYSKAGINIREVVQNSVKLNFSLAKTKFALEAIYKSVGSKFFTLLTKQSDIFREKLYKNMPKIQAALERFVKFIFKAFEAVTTLGTRLWSLLTRVYDFFIMLDKATDGWSTIILGVIAAWKLLNLSFLATPLGMLLTGFVAILALFDDFKTWQEGGQSLFDWSKAVPIINAVTDALKTMADVWRSIVDIIGNVVLAFYQLFHADFSGFFESLLQSLKSVFGLFSGIGSALKGVADMVGVTGTAIGEGIAGGVKGFFGGGATNGPVAQNLNNNPAASPLMNPVGSNVQNSSTNQNVSQQTNINIMGSTDASSVGKSVAGEQNRVNFDMTRNLKGAAH